MLMEERELFFEGKKVSRSVWSGSRVVVAKVEKSQVRVRELIVIKPGSSTPFAYSQCKRKRQKEKEKKTERY